MEFTWGFLLVFIFIIFPGLILRRLYFYGDFSKQFGYHEPIVKNLINALIPGLLNFTLGFFLYLKLFSGVSIKQIVNTINTINKFLVGNGAFEESVFHYAAVNGFKMFCAINILALLVGSVSGPIIRLSGLDIRFKLFRYKNTWFYLFHGLHFKLKEKKYLQAGEEDDSSNESNRKYLFAIADILLDIKSGDRQTFYSGVVIDYELDANNPQELSKIILKNAKRYGINKSNGKMEPRIIPGGLFVLDCKNLVNINLTYVYGRVKKTWTNVVGRAWYNTFQLISLLAFIPIVVFKLDALGLEWYNHLYETSWLKRIVFFLFSIQLIQLLNLFTETKDPGVYRLINGKELFAKVLATVVFWVIAYLLIWN
jgi:hypothetical protein